MSTEHRESDLIRSWLDETYEAEGDPQDYLDHLLDEVSETAQQRRGWWHLPRFGRARTVPTANQTTEYQPSPVPATNGHTPTVSGRTTSMLSPAKAITAGALVFAIGGVMLIAQPFGQQQDSLPGAETDGKYLAPVPFSTVWDGERQLGDAVVLNIVEASDPRLDGAATIRWHDKPYTARSGERYGFSHYTVRIENDEGAWQGSALDFTGSAPEYDGVELETIGTFVAVGEGAYEGLYAVMVEVDGWRDIKGVILSEPPPEAPAPPEIPQ